MKRDRIPAHNPCRRWRRPWSTVCACGMDAWPCPVAVMLERQATMQPVRLNPPGQRPAWDAPPRNMTTVPLLTRGQKARSRESHRW